jgi:hypothetical protein
VPQTASEFVLMMANDIKRMQITASYNGVLKMNALPYILNEKREREYIPAHHWDSYDFKTMIETTFRRTIPFFEFQREVRIVAREFLLPFGADELNDASERWYDEVCRDRLWQIKASIDYSDSVMVRQRGQASLRRLAETCFDCSDGVDFVVAVFNKFIWQVKCKIEGLPVTDHLMPVLLGVQGNGKSTLIRKMLEPIAELVARADFSEITDNRNIRLWRNFVIFMDEMGWASKADVDTVKNVITADTLDRRPMRSNSLESVQQNATLIGASNSLELSDLIRDTSGTRRFASLTMIDQPDRSAVNDIDWSEVWQSVDETAADPMNAVRAVLQAKQEAERPKHPIEHWISMLDRKWMGGALTNPNRKFTSSELHDAFREFEDLRFTGNRTHINTFSKFMKALAKRPNPSFALVGEKGHQAIYEWAGVFGGEGAASHEAQAATMQDSDKVIRLNQD